MAKICYSKWSYWIPRVGVFLGLFAVITAEPPGFLSISCGSNTTLTDENNITWVTDADYIDVGQVEYIGDATQYTYGSYMHYLRLFPKPLDKSCYQLPVAPDVPYLLRLWFILGNYSGFQQLPSFNFSIETTDMLTVQNITAEQNGLYDERIFVTSDTVMYVCLIRTSDSDDPFISGIELRPLEDGMYAQAKPGTILHPMRRIDVGGNYPILRYPKDNFDRIWIPNTNSSDVNLYRFVSSAETISPNNTQDLPPTVVMQTAWVVNSYDGIEFPLRSLRSYQGSKSLLLLYFAEIEMLNMSETRSFYVVINNETRSEEITLVRNYSALELTFVRNQLLSFALLPAPNSNYLPIINAYEHYSLIDTQPPTYSQDIEALDAIKRSFYIKDWISDPCYLIHWKGIGCDSSSSVIRISEIDLSRRNLTGSVPNEIVHLTALVNVFQMGA